jgi:hypothetical protein
MADTKIYSFSAATLSWIDPEAAKKYLLPEWDHGGEPDRTLTFPEVTETPNCRFAHLLACWIVVEGGKIVRRGAFSASGLHERKSFLGTHPQDYETRRDFTEWTSEQAIFVQTVGCRTQAPEVIGGRTGEDAARGAADGAFGPIIGPAVGPIVGPIGRQIGKGAAEAVSAFPPIWTRIAIYMHAGGACAAEVRANSLFPSMTYYESRVAQTNVPPPGLLWTKRSGYDGVPHYKAWLVQGWGNGNPWLVDHP